MIFEIEHQIEPLISTIGSTIDYSEYVISHEYAVSQRVFLMLT